MTTSVPRFAFQALGRILLLAAFSGPVWAHGTGGSDGGPGGAAGPGDGAGGAGPGGGDGGAGAGAGGSGPSVATRQSCFDRSVVAWRDTPECAVYARDPIERDAASERRFREMPSQAVDSAASGTTRDTDARRLR